MTEALNSQPIKGAAYVAYNAYIGALFFGAWRLATAVYYIAKHFFAQQSYKNAYDVYDNNLKSESRQRTHETLDAQTTRRREMRDAQRERRKEETEARRQNQNDARLLAKQRRQAEKKGLWDQANAWLTEKGNNLGNETSSKKNKALNAAAHLKDKATNAVLEEYEDTKDSAVESITSLKRGAAKLATYSFVQIEEAKMAHWKAEAARGAVEVFVPFAGAWFYTHYDRTHRDITALGIKEMLQARALDNALDTFRPEGIYQYRDFF